LFSVVNLKLASKAASKDRTIQRTTEGLFLYEDECVTVLHVTSGLYGITSLVWMVGRRWCLHACRGPFAVLRHILRTERHMLSPLNPVDSYQYEICIKREVGEVYLLLV